MKIVRYLNLSDAQLLFHPNAESTFCMCTQYYYRQIEGEESNPLKDKDECIARFKRSGIVQGEESYEEINNLFLSCWSICEDVDKLDWNLLKDKSDVAVISTVDKVENFLKRIFRIKSACEYKSKNRYLPPSSSLIHGPVQYTEQKPMNFSIDDSVFIKNPKFERQKEYRFVLRCNPSPQYQKIIFYTSFCEVPDPNKHFAEEIIFNPRLLNEKHSDHTNLSVSSVLKGIAAENLEGITTDFKKINKKI